MKKLSRWIQGESSTFFFFSIWNINSLKACFSTHFTMPRWRFTSFLQFFFPSSRKTFLQRQKIMSRRASKRNQDKLKLFIITRFGFDCSLAAGWTWNFANKQSKKRMKSRMKKRAKFIYKGYTESERKNESIISLLLTFHHTCGKKHIANFNFPIQTSVKCFGNSNLSFCGWLAGFTEKRQQAAALHNRPLVALHTRCSAVHRPVVLHSSCI